MVYYVYKTDEQATPRVRNCPHLTRSPLTESILTIYSKISIIWNNLSSSILYICNNFNSFGHSQKKLFISVHEKAEVLTLCIAENQGEDPEECSRNANVCCSPPGSRKAVCRMLISGRPLRFQSVLLC
jgi:hypothetical protein